MFCYFYLNIVRNKSEWAGTVNVQWAVWLMNFGAVSTTGKKFFSSPKHQHQPLGAASLLINGGAVAGGKAV